MRLIDADALKEYVKEQTNLPLPKNRLYMVVPVEDFITNLIDNQPTADAEPKHGRWIEDFVEYECSVCGGRISDSTLADNSTPNYCPNCGARMDEVDDGK